MTRSHDSISYMWNRVGVIIMTLLTETVAHDKFNSREHTQPLLLFVHLYSGSRGWRKTLSVSMIGVFFSQKYQEPFNG